MPNNSAQRGLRFDKVAVRLVAQLQATLRDLVPEGKTMLVTVSAPIRVPAKTAATLDEHIRLWLANPSRPPDLCTTINENRIRVLVVSGASRGSPNVLGFVHNPEVDTSALLAEVQASLIE